MTRRERRQPTPREWQALVSPNLVTRRIPHNPGPMRAKPPLFFASRIKQTFAPH
jgi:hypothetical protein